RQGARPAAPPDLPQDRVSAGHAPDRPAHRQPVHRDAEGFVSGVGDGRVGTDAYGADYRAAGFPRLRDADRGCHHLLGAVDLFRTDPVAYRAPLRQGLRAAVACQATLRFAETSSTQTRLRPSDFAR